MHYLATFFKTASGWTFLLCLSLIPAMLPASDISDFNKFAWSENSGWLNFKATHSQVTVFNDHLEGYVWAENVGWIRLGTFMGGGSHTYLNSGADNYGVNNDGNGNLSGFGWGENIGWVNFNPSHSQVTIDPISGDFDGYAWSENIGWVHFKNNSPEYRVTQTSSVTETIPLALDLNETSELSEFQNTTAITGTNNQINLSQNAITGMLTAVVNNIQFHLRPIRRADAAQDLRPGISLDEDGLYNMTSDEGTTVTLLAEPLQVDQLFSALTAMGFNSQQQNFGLLRIESTIDPDGNNIWFAARPGYESVVTNVQQIQALTSVVAEEPLNTVIFEHNFVVGGLIYKQKLYPTPADWGRLKNYLESFGDVRIDLHGKIILTIGNNTFHAISDYKVEPSDQRLGQVELLPIDDINGDKINDFQIIYPNGDMQYLYLLKN